MRSIIIYIIAALVGCTEAAVAMADVNVSAIDPMTARQSRFADSIVLDGSRDQPLCRVQADPTKSRAWRVTLQRLQRQSAAPVVFPGPDTNNLPEIISAQYAYTAGQELSATWPPRRTNPCGSAAVQIAWGMSAAAPARLAADWPPLGGSIVVVGSYVEVFASLQDTPDHSANPIFFPTATASIVPAEGLPTESSGELSLVQRINVPPARDAIPPATCPTWGGVVFVPDFARRVKVTLVSVDQPALCGPHDPPDDATFSDSFSGDPTAVMTWFDDAGESVDSWMQGIVFGTVINIPPVIQTITFSPLQWHPVPGNATTLAIRGLANFDGQAFVHWRIAP